MLIVEMAKGVGSWMRKQLQKEEWKEENGNKIEELVKKIKKKLTYKKVKIEFDKKIKEKNYVILT